jgi:hypothetical protein
MRSSYQEEHGGNESAGGDQGHAYTLHVLQLEIDMTPTFDKVAGFIGIAATAFSAAAASSLSKRWLRNFGTARKPTEPDYGATSATKQPRLYAAKKQIFVRLEETRAQRARKEVVSRTSRWSSRSLTFGQYIIGGILASSFVQQKTSPQLIGIFGVLVLIASLITQHYHPEVTAQIATLKVGQLKDLIRESEDRLVVIDTLMPDASDNPHQYLELLESISAQLKNILTLSSNDIHSNASTSK